MYNMSRSASDASACQHPEHAFQGFYHVICNIARLYTKHDDPQQHYLCANKRARPVWGTRYSVLSLRAFLDGFLMRGSAAGRLYAVSRYIPGTRSTSIVAAGISVNDPRPSFRVRLYAIEGLGGVGAMVDGRREKGALDQPPFPQLPSTSLLHDPHRPATT
jgi:hypothetical protein